jgi:hypothetical protein
MPPPSAEELEEWNTFQCAKWLGVPPWELQERSAAWLNKAAYYASIEAEVQEMKANNNGN